MYINFGPSKKDLYKIILLLICLLLTFRSCVKAEEIHTFSMSSSNYDTTSTQTNFYLVNGSTSTLNKGIGYIYGSYRTYMVQPNTYDFVYGVFVGNGGDINACNISTATIDNQTTDVVIGSFICPFDSNKSFDYIRFVKGDNFTKINIHIPFGSVTFIPQSGNSASDISQIINVLQDGNITYLINQFRTRTNEQLVDQYNLINSIKSQLTTNSTTISNIENNTHEINDAINDSSIDENSANDLTNNSAFQDANGLQAIIQAPLNFIRSLTSSTCSNISLTIPYIDADVSLPCMSTIYNKALGQQLVNLIALVINGVVLYRYCLKILQIVKDAKNPNKDGLEVLDL